MVGLGGETSNTLFQELEQWEQYLKGKNLDVHILALLDENKRITPHSHESEETKKKAHHHAAPRL